ncbi:trans-homoaconitate synthase [Caldanaerobacter subterraneus subsp. pacificus DSM 12653]|uniref:Trans-homoaconitate synthase n=1 Tax=Caldanaerobacter subterraneus subsp. pacificus DSM 12653 TaxID=391606 RepID=A0A0F5PP57_9THEO|nr:trans-homoaconitate synthase [Caldanaerobacter subterraneus subsp. pacificus DSM 12653]
MGAAIFYNKNCKMLLTWIKLLCKIGCKRVFEGGSYMAFKKDKPVYIVDTTLRDGEQTAGVVFANNEKIRIAQMLYEIGIDQLEVGIPTMGGDEKEYGS